MRLFTTIAVMTAIIIVRNENKIKPEKINYAQEISQAQTTNFRPYLIYVPYDSYVEQIQVFL